MKKLFALLENTEGFNIIKREKKSGAVSHAYLVVCADGENLTEILKEFAKLIACKEGAPCGKCRDCTLIDSGAHSDVLVYPKTDSVKTEDIVDLIEQSYIKPIESDKKIFILSHAETMNLPAQNKLLKTLEEPPKNVHLILGATTEYGLLPTVLSRVKKIEIKGFSEEVLIDFLSEECPDLVRLKEAVSCADGTVSGVKRLYEDEKFREIKSLCESIVIDMLSSKQVLHFAEKVMVYKEEIELFLSVLERVLGNLLYITAEQEQLVKNKADINALKRATGFKKGSVLNALELICTARKKLKFNANAQMLVEWLLFGILEGKHKWQKL
ncbi:MAG: hypothetical protein IJY57_00825 [Clostridia bacterium]|nr:hypothetical protein [Clostridia bacterium]